MNEPLSDRGSSMNSKHVVTPQASVRLAREMSAVHHKKIRSLKSKISSGKYHVDNLALAKALFLAR